MIDDVANLVVSEPLLGRGVWKLCAKTRSVFCHPGPNFPEPGLCVSPNFIARVGHRPSSVLNLHCVPGAGKLKGSVLPDDFPIISL